MRSTRVLLIIAAAGIFALISFQNCSGGKRTLNFAEPSSLSIEAQARDVLLRRCSSCHGSHSGGSGGFRFVLSQPLLLSSGFVVPNNPSASKLINRILDGSMPRAGFITASEFGILKNWVQSGAGYFEPEPELVPVVVTPESDEDILNLIYSDMTTNVLPAERASTRYLTFHNIQNSGLYGYSADTFQKGLNKLLNSLSWNSAVRTVTALNSSRTVYRVRLSSYNFPSSLWASVLGSYPYRRFPTNGTYQTKLSALISVAGELPFVRGDWFLYALSQPPLYNLALQLPANLSGLESRLSLNIVSNISSGQVLRAGFASSFASLNNRMIERHSLGGNRALWKSYEFADNLGRHNVLQYPLGPQSAEPTNYFVSGGGEIIFDLPNGFHGYYAHDINNNLIDAPDPSLLINPAANKNFVIGISCFKCHSAGVNTNTDVVNNWVTQNQTYFGNPTTILALYRGPSTMTTAFSQDINTFQNTLSNLQINTSDPEPISTSVQNYEDPITLEKAAADLGVPPSTLQTFLGTANAPALLSPLVNSSGTVTRSDFQSVFASAVSGLLMSTQLP
jgi:hypothetical protein